MNDLLAAYRDVSNNWAKIQASKMCGRCSCVQIFPAEEIVAWEGLDMGDFENPDAVNKQTALCPRCGSEAVLGDQSGFPITPPFLTRMNEAWFQRTIIRKPAPKK